jgi:hypothetical protein
MPSRLGTFAPGGGQAAPRTVAGMSGTIVRVYCVDGPYLGLQYLDADTGRVLFVDNATETYPSVYRVADATRSHGYPTAYLAAPE